MLGEESVVRWVVYASEDPVDPAVADAEGDEPEDERSGGNAERDEKAKSWVSSAL